MYDWWRWAREDQRCPPGDWFIWLILAGRGYGKTRTGVEWIREQVEGDTPHVAPPGAPERIALVAETAADARDVMVEGESGILACSRPGFGPVYEPSKRRLTWPNGITATLYSAEKPDQLRGPQHAIAWGDELAKWRYLDDCWDNLMLGLRLGTKPRVCVTTTPRPIKLLKDLVKNKGTYVTRGSTYDNRENLPESFYTQVITKYEGTRIGRQELMAEILEDVPGALWQRSWIDMGRQGMAPPMRKVVVGIDPAVTGGENSDETGIVVAGVATHTASGQDHGYVLSDVSLRATPEEWGRKAVAAFYRYEANYIVAEVNNGGDLVKSLIRNIDPNVPVKDVRASRGKAIRAEPAAALYEQGRIHHIGSMPLLEDQMCSFVAGQEEKSPDRMDALVWALSELFPISEQWSASRGF